MLNSRTRGFLATMLIALLVILTGCGGVKKGATEGIDNTNKEPVKIGVVLPTTGPSGVYGKQQYNGMQLVVDLINKEGGILGGRPIQLLLENDEGNPEKGVSAVKKLMQQGVSAFCGAVNSSVALAEMHVTKEANMLQVVTLSQAVNLRQQGHPYAIFNSNTTNMDGAFYLKYISETIKPKTIAILVENTDFGKSSAASMKEYFADHPGSPKIVTTESFNTTDTDYTVILTKIKGLNPDAIYLVSSAINVQAAIFSQLLEIGFNGMKIMAGPGAVNTDFMNAAGDAAEGAIGQGVYFDFLDNPENKAFVEAMKNKFNGQLPQPVEEIGYEGLYTLVKAMDKAGSDTDYAKIMDAFKSTTWKTPRGDVKYDANGQAQLKDMYYVQVKNGKITVLN